MSVNEDVVLQPKDPSLQNSDEWPTFPLTNANIVSTATGKATSLLSAYKANPVRVTGQLKDIDDELLHLGMRVQNHQCLPSKLRSQSARRIIRSIPSNSQPLPLLPSRNMTMDLMAFGLQVKLAGLKLKEPCQATNPSWMRWVSPHPSCTFSWIKCGVQGNRTSNEAKWTSI